MGTLTDNYQIIKELGRGGMGTVYLANDRRLDRKVAVKLLQLPANLTLEQKSEVISRFQKEAKAVAKLSHPNIVNIHDIGEENSQYFMVMEFLEGKSIGTILEQEKSLPIDECVDISIQMCRALDYIHKNSIVHRDIKPDNIIIGSDKIAKITDFGIAQNDTEQMRLTQDGAILGSIMYISPEQLRNSKDVDSRADIFSYGVTFYQMLTGQLPFNGETVGEVVSKVLNENPELPRKINPSIPPELEAIVMRAINKDKEKRYKSMEDMLKDLQNLVATTSFRKGNTTVNTKNQTINNVQPSKTSSVAENIRPNIKVEKASKETKLLRVVFKIITALLIIHISYYFITGILTPSVVNDVMSSKLNGSMIQGPYSQSLVEKAVSFNTALYSLILVLSMLLFSAYSFPIESKGLHRNFNFKAEVLPIILVMIFSVIYTFAFVARYDTNKEYISSYKQDLNSKIDNIDSILSQKGIISYSKTDDYKKKYRKLIASSTERQGRHDKPETQLRLTSTMSDHILLKVNSLNKQDDPTFQITNDLLNNIFAISEPVKELYETKAGQLLSLVSKGAIGALPPEAKYTVTKDINNKISSVKLEWNKDSFIINQNQLKLKHNDTDYVYPPPTDKMAKISFNNITDEKLYVFLYNPNGDLKDKMILASKENKEIQVREQSENTVIIIPSTKLAIPMSNSLSFNNGDSITIDKIFYQNEDYYSLKEKSFIQNSEYDVKKVELKSNNIFATDDADINTYNLTSLRK